MCECGCGGHRRSQQGALMIAVEEEVLFVCAFEPANLS